MRISVLYIVDPHRRLKCAIVYNVTVNCIGLNTWTIRRPEWLDLKIIELLNSSKLPEMQKKKTAVSVTDNSMRHIIVA
jgi:hypothetical protein